jgi:hypothetical protein
VDEMGSVQLLKGYEMPIIREDDFPYYPRKKEALRSCWSADDDEDEEIGRLRMVRRTLGRGGKSDTGLRGWAKKMLRKLRLLR